MLNKYNIKTRLTFIIPSLLGLLLFITPIHSQGSLTIPIAVISKALQSLLSDYLIYIIMSVIVSSAVISIICRFFKIPVIQNSPFLHTLFNITPVWFVIRILGAVFILLTLFTLGPEAIYSSHTGGLVLHDLLPVLFCVFFFAGMLLPLLLNFGLLELFGTLFTKIMRPIFNLPGRSAIDCLASWLGDGSVGILLTNKQYEDKFYTQREAAIIGTTFSAVSITFSLVVIAQVGLEHLFVQFYLTVCLAGLVAAIIVPKLPPLCWKKDIYIDGSTPNTDNELTPVGHSLFSWGIEQALYKAAHAPSVKKTLIDGLKNAIDMIFGVLPVVMAIGTVALVLAEYTPLFDYLGYPFIPFLKLLHIPEAELASKTIVVGFADMFLPSILASAIHSDMTRFVIAAMSVTQLIYMSEIGALLLGSKIPINIAELFIVFILRTLVTLPVIAGIAHLLF
ncbi:YjiH family protein [Psychromonas sp. CD1]|uniref:YjiH family protein n=1 Tax=Psychromonas sp. CD1 TaxID=1979839 RepID=UPI0035AE9CBB